MAPALRWAETKDILMFHDEVTKTVSWLKPQLFSEDRKKQKKEPKRNRTSRSFCLPATPLPLGHSDSHTEGPATTRHVPDPPRPTARPAPQHFPEKQGDIIIQSEQISASQ